MPKERLGDVRERCVRDVPLLSRAFQGNAGGIRMSEQRPALLGRLRAHLQLRSQSILSSAPMACSAAGQMEDGCNPL